MFNALLICFSTRQYNELKSDIDKLISFRMALPDRRWARGTIGRSPIRETFRVSQNQSAYNCIGARNILSIGVGYENAY